MSDTDRTVPIQRSEAEPVATSMESPGFRRAQEANEAYLALRKAVDSGMSANIIPALVGCVSWLLQQEGAEIKGKG